MAKLQKGTTETNWQTEARKFYKNRYKQRDRTIEKETARHQNEQKKRKKKENEKDTGNNESNRAEEL